MSSLYKLSISGIRSFSPKERETIQFGSPLTLICGQNGCGKTTIIESLKFVTTGDLPPNSKGGAFVNDPAIADRLLVNAEIKLGFISVDGKLMTVTRNMQLNRKRAVRGSAQATNTFKSLEGQLAVISNGSKKSFSTKNLELDSRVPLYLGASRAVLEYVIFCHQDDSLWPLSEAGLLKKRFDEIFEALKFTRALDTLKLIRKEMATSLKFIEQNVQHSKVDQVRARKIRERVAVSTQKLEQYTADITVLTEQIERLQKQAESLFQSNQAFQKTLSEHERLCIMIRTTGASLERLESSIKLLPETDDELSSMLSNFESVEENKRKQCDRVEAEILGKDSELTSLDAEHRKLVRQEGLLLGKKNIFEQNLELLKLLSEDLAKQYGIDNFCFDVEESLDMLRNDIVATDVLQENKMKRNVAMQQLQAASDNFFKETERLGRFENDIELFKENIKRLKASVAALLSQEDSLEVEKAQLKNLRAKFERSIESLDFEGMQSKIELERARVAELETESDNLMKKINAAAKMHDTYSKMDLLRESLSVNKDMLEKYVRTHDENFQKLTNEALVPQTCEIILDSSVRANEEKLKVLEADVEAKSSSRRVAEMELKSSNNLLTELKQKLTTYHRNIFQVLEEEDFDRYDELLKEAEEDYKSAQYNCNTFEVTKSFKKKAIAIAKDSNCCALCNRGMSGEEKETFVADVKASILSATLEKLTEVLESTQKSLDDLRSVQYEVREVPNLKKQISALRQEVIDRSEDVKKRGADLEHLIHAKSAIEKLLEELESLSKPLAKLMSLAEDRQSLENRLSALDRELGDSGTAHQSVSELQRLQQQKNYEAKLLRQVVEDLIDERSASQRELAKLESNVKDKEIQVGKLELSLNEAKSLQIQIKELNVQVNDAETKRQASKERLDEMKAVKISAEESSLNINRECDKEDETYREKLSGIDIAIEKLQRFKILITEFEEKDSGLLQENANEIKRVLEAIKGLRAEKAAVEENLKTFQTELSESLSVKRNIRDNIEYRQTNQELEALQNSIHALDIENAELEQKRYHSKSKQLHDQIAELNSQHYGKVGEVKQIQDQMHTMQKELQTEFKDVEKRYQSEWINLQTNMLVSTDLQTYSQALDSAIMKYHSMKMNEINRTLRELWNQTYKGTDIDSIEIKCEVSTQNKARSYNYRVVMYKKSSELDMRGRCSAGQKVLTSILIRLALAECFGTNCGIIALDEPTTNLDVENAESLAHALNDIIAFRKSQKNFQLIVITHDEKFLSHIEGDRFTDNFYRLERDENQHSIIKSLPIHLMRSD